MVLIIRWKFCDNLTDTAQRPPNLPRQCANSISILMMHIKNCSCQLSSNPNIRKLLKAILSDSKPCASTHFLSARCTSHTLSNLIKERPLPVSLVLFFSALFKKFFSFHTKLHSLSLSNGATAQGGSRPPLGVSSILPGLGRLLSNFYILASLHLPPLHLPNAVWVYL